MLEHGGSLGDVACTGNRHLLNHQQQPNLRNPRSSSSSSSQEDQQGHDEYNYENISNVFD